MLRSFRAGRYSVKSKRDVLRLEANLKQMNDFIIESALSSDQAAILNLLTETELPHDGVNEYLDSFLVARDESARLVGCAGLELHGKLGLLRSVAVSPDLQKSGLGSRLVATVIGEAKKSGLDEIILLTTTARDFFVRRFDFVETTRENYNDTLKDSPEWTLPRCSSAVVMSLNLTEDNSGL